MAAYLRALFSVYWPALGASLVFVLHSLWYAGWILDDAAISFVYARNLAFGFGLTAQPGTAPVEAFSNPAWVGFMALFFKLHLFHPYFTPKIIGGLCSVAVFFLFNHTISRIGLLSCRQVFLVLILLAISPVWTANAAHGLENPLYALGIAGLWGLLLRIGYGPGLSKSGFFLAGSLVALLGLIRPEGLLFSLTLAFALFLRQTPWHQSIAPLVISALGCALWYGAYLIFRWGYFHDLFPAPFYLKGISHSTGWGSLVKIHQLGRGTAGPLGWVAVVFPLLGWVFLWKKGKTGFGLHLTGGFFLLGIIIFLLLPYDWLWWYRYATPFVLWVFLLGVSIAKEVIPVWAKSTRWRRAIFIALGSCVLAGSIVITGYTGWRLSQAPIVPFEEVAEKYGRRINKAADLLEVNEGSLLLPDLGGTLYVSRLKVHDLAGFLDTRIRETGISHAPAFYNYVFEELKPTFIHVHGIWLEETAFETDPRFIAQYDTLATGRSAGSGLRYGYFVRKEVLAGKSHRKAQAGQVLAEGEKMDFRFGFWAKK
jgi:hypothetical protein